jgi:excinuclease UvrABC nuclease subunit
MQWTHQLAFDLAQPEQTLAQLPSTAAVYALYGRDPHAEPYVGRTPDLRRRLHRLLTPSASHPRRLHLAGLVAQICYTHIGSELEGTLLLYRVSQEAFGPDAAKRMHLRTPGFLRMSMGNDYPRLYVTTSITHAAAADLFGPFASRAAADRYAEQVLDLFLLRHCFQDLEPDPAFPGCIYSEMKKCLAPCYKGCTDQRYTEEAAGVHSFLSTGGKSLLAQVATERDRASEALDFENAAAAHGRYGKVEAVAGLASEAARSLASQYVVVVQPAHSSDGEEHVALCLLKQGTWSGPVLYSVAGMRHPNEQSGSSSLFAHPVAFAAVPLADEPGSRTLVKGDILEERLAQALATLEEQQQPGSRQQLCEHLAIFARWYYRPQAKREGEAVFFNTGDKHATPPAKLVLRAISRVWRAAQMKRAAPQVISATALG